MKYLLLAFFSLMSLQSFSQADSVRTIEPGQETSFGNYELLIIALLGLLVLIGVWFWFRRAKKNKG